MGLDHGTGDPSGFEFDADGVVNGCDASVLASAFGAGGWDDIAGVSCRAVELVREEV